MAQPQRQHENNHSSIFEKVPPELRRQIDVAIVERCPPTFQAVWMTYNLAELGVSYTAFYRYARRLRDRANLVEIANLTADEDGDIDASIRKLLARRLLEALLNDDELPPAEIAGLMSALRQAAKTTLQDRSHTEDSRLAWARLEHDRAELRLKADHLQTMRQRLLRVLDDSSDHQPKSIPDLDAAPRQALEKQQPDDPVSRDTELRNSRTGKDEKNLCRADH